MDCHFMTIHDIFTNKSKEFFVVVPLQLWSVLITRKDRATILVVCVGFL